METSLFIGKSGYPDSLDPAVTGSTNSWTISYPAHQRLVRFREGSAWTPEDVEGDLARAWEAGRDGRSWTFTLVPGHRFASGRPVDAHAVRFSIERLLRIAGGPSADLRCIRAVDCPDDRTVRFELHAPFAPFLAVLATNAAGIIDPAVVEHARDGDLGQGYLRRRTLGSGPYQVREADDQGFVLVPNPHWPDPLPFRNIVIRVIPKASDRMAMLARGELDIVENLAPGDLRMLAAKPGIEIIDQPSLLVTYLYLNTRRKPLDDVRVRRALSHAVDYGRIVERTLGGAAIPMLGAVPAGMWGHDDTLAPYRYDPGEARRLLAEAGARNLELTYLSDYPGLESYWNMIGDVVRENFAEVGVSLDVVRTTYEEMRARLDRGEFDVSVGDWTTSYADPSGYMNYWFDSANYGLAGNRAFYDNPEVDALLRRALGEATPSARLELYGKAQRIALDEAPYIFLVQRRYQCAMSRAVRNYVYHPMQWQIWDFTRLRKATTVPA